MSKRKLIKIIEKQDKLLEEANKIGASAITDIEFKVILRTTVRMYQLAFEYLLDEVDDETIKSLLLFTFSLDPDYKYRNGRYLSMVELYKKKPEYKDFIQALYSGVKTINEQDQGEK